MSIARITENLPEGISDFAKTQAMELLKKRGLGFDYLAGVLDVDPDEAREIWASKNLTADTCFKVLGELGVGVTISAEEIT